ncbi:MAG: OB-fold domain-containing protein [Acidimicrobiales bacterium]|nr:OB-fold domain-containing protein [Acidimicrobiales bacterium]
MTDVTRPREISVDPYRLEDDTWIDLPSSIEGRSRPGAPQESEQFWQSLRDGEVSFQRCTECRRYTHYPVGGCQWCGGPLRYEVVDGRATVNTWTLCLLEFGPGMETPYLAAIVNPVCEPELQLMTNLVRCRVSDVRIGMTVKPVIFNDDQRALLFYEPE